MVAGPETVLFSGGSDVRTDDLGKHSSDEVVTIEGAEWRDLKDGANVRLLPNQIERVRESLVAAFSNTTDWWTSLEHAEIEVLADQCVLEPFVEVEKGRLRVAVSNYRHALLTGSHYSGFSWDSLADSDGFIYFDPNYVFGVGSFSSVDAA